MMQLLKWIHINVKIGGEINFPAVQNSGSHVCKNLSILDAECTNVSGNPPVLLHGNNCSNAES